MSTRTITITFKQYYDLRKSLISNISDAIEVAEHLTYQPAESETVKSLETTLGKLVKMVPIEWSIEADQLSRLQ